MGGDPAGHANRGQRVDANLLRVAAKADIGKYYQRGARVGMVYQISHCLLDDPTTIGNYALDKQKIRTS